LLAQHLKQQFNCQGLSRPRLPPQPRPPLKLIINMSMLMLDALVKFHHPLADPLKNVITSLLLVIYSKQHRHMNKKPRATMDLKKKMTMIALRAPSLMLLLW
jgi:hypothetical protein